jgi:hypothetical protein
LTPPNEAKKSINLDDLDIKKMDLSMREPDLKSYGEFRLAGSFANELSFDPKRE